MIQTLHLSIPNWNTWIPFDLANSTFTSGYGSGHKYLHQQHIRDWTQSGNICGFSNQDDDGIKMERLHDGSESERLEEAETNRFGETGTEYSVINHGEVERRHEQLSLFLGVVRWVLRLGYGLNIAVVTLQRHGDGKGRELFGIELYLLWIIFYQKGFVGFFGTRNVETDLQEYSFSFCVKPMINDE